MTFKESMNPPEIENTEAEKLPGRVYLVESTSDDTVLYALDVNFTSREISWFDGTKKRIMRLDEITDNTPERFTFKRAEKGGGGEYTFTPMTLEIFNEKVKDRIVSPQDFEDEDDMLTALESTKNTAW